MNDENIVKKVCKELGVTQKELAEKIGVAEGTVNRWSSKPDIIPEQSIKTINLLIENEKLKEQVKVLKLLKNTLSSL